MDKKQKLSSEEQKKADMEKMRKRVENLLPSKADIPASLSIQQAEELKTRISELESKLEEKLAQQKPAKEQVALTLVSDSVLPSVPVQQVDKPSVVHSKAEFPGSTVLNPRNAFWSIIVLLAAAVINSIVAFKQASTSGEWQAWMEFGVVALFLVATLISAFLSQRGRMYQAIGLLIGGFLITIIARNALTEGLGVFYGLMSIAVTSVLAFINFPKKTANRFTFTGIVIGVLLVVFDLIVPPYRQPAPAVLLNSLPYVASFVVLLFLTFLVRQVITGSIRTKLISAFVVMAILSMGIVAFTAQRSLSNNLTAGIVDSQEFLASSQGLQIGQAINSQYDKLKSLATIKTIQEGTEAANLDESRPHDVTKIEQLNLAWREAIKAKNATDPLAIKVLYNPLSTQLRRFQKTFPENTEILLTDQKGFSIAATTLPANYYQADALWWRTAHTTGQYIGQPIFDPVTNSVAIDMAIPIYSYNTGDFVGVMRTTVDFNLLTDLLVEGLRGQTGYTIIYQPNDQEIKLRSLEDGNYEIFQDFASFDLQGFVKSPNTSMEFSLDGNPVLASSAPVKLYTSTLAGEGANVLNDLNWKIVVVQGRSEVLQPVEAETRNNLILVIITSIVVIMIAYFLAGYMTNPIIRLNAFALRIASGDLTAEAKVETQDEIGTLATTFNNMTSQLRSLFGSLEQRVIDRTRNLELASDVGRTITEHIADPNQMLTKAVETIRARFDLYYTQIYLVDSSGQTITLRAGTGEVGRQLLGRRHSLAVGPSSLNGRAVAEKKAVIVSDTSQHPGFLPNPLLPNTRSEMVVPLIVGGQVIGALDMQSETPGTLNDANLPAFEVLAGLFSVAIQNANLFAETEQARQQMEANARRGAELGWQDFLDGIERSEKIGYTFNQAEITPLKNTNELHSENTLNIPIMVTGATVGAIQIVEEERAWTAQETELVQATAGQLAQHIDNLRLLAQAEKYRLEAEQVTRRLTREGWNEYIDNGDANLGYIYNLNKVESFSGNGRHITANILKQPLSVRDETVGELMVSVENAPSDAKEVVESIAKQLSSHIETLRLSEELLKRAKELEELDRLKSAFLANMSHELRTPLNSILGFTDVMLEGLDGNLTDYMDNDLRLIQKNGQHLLHLINDVLDMAKIESGRMNLNPENFKVHSVFDEAISITSTFANEKKLSLLIDENSDPEIGIYADNTRLRQVMINLVNNAIKFTDAGKIALSVSRMDDARVLITVKDTGMGIPPNELETVFQEFSQVDTSTTRKAGGTGLGLPISRRLVEMHGGRLWVESTGVEGEGSTFLIEMPVEARITEVVEKQEK